MWGEGSQCCFPVYLALVAGNVYLVAVCDADCNAMLWRRFCNIGVGEGLMFSKHLLMATGFYFQIYDLYKQYQETFATRRLSS